MVVWDKDSAARIYSREHDFDRDENGYYGGGIGSTDGLLRSFSTPVTLRDAYKHGASRTEAYLRKGGVEAIAVWKDESLKSRLTKVSVMISGEEVAKLGRWEAIEAAIEAKTTLKPGEKISKYSITAETSKYTSSMTSVSGSKMKYYIIGDGLSTTGVLKNSKGFDTRTEAKAALKNHLSRIHDNTFGLPAEENFEIIGVTKVSEAKAELSKLAVRADVTIVTVDPAKPYDGWYFYGIGAM